MNCFIWIYDMLMFFNTVIINTYCTIIQMFESYTWWLIISNFSWDIVESILKILLAISFFVPWNFNISFSYSLWFRTPCCLRFNKYALDSTKREEDDHRYEWPIYLSGYGNLRNFAILLGGSQFLLFPTTCFLHPPDW